MTSCENRGVPLVTWEPDLTATAERIQCPLSGLPHQVTCLRTSLIFVLSKFHLPGSLWNNEHSTKVPLAPLFLCELDFERRKEALSYPAMTVNVLLKSHPVRNLSLSLLFLSVRYISLELARCCLYHTLLHTQLCDWSLLSLRFLFSTPLPLICFSSLLT